MTSTRACLVLAAVICLAGALEAQAPFTVSVVPSDAAELSAPAPRDQALTTDQIEAMVRRAVDLVGGMSSVVPNGAELVVIKPNVGTNKPSGSGIITDARVVRAVALMVHEAEPGARILIAEGPGGWIHPDSLESLGFEVWPDMVGDGWADTGYRDLEEELIGLGLDVALHDLNYDDAPVLQVPGGGLARDEYEIAGTINRADAWINVPVAKTHGAKITCCMKNHFGILPGRVYGWNKSRGTEDHRGIPHAPSIVDEAFVDLWLLSQMDLNVVDMIRGAEAGAFTGEPRRGNMVVAGRDPVATDMVVGRLMGFNPHDLEFVSLAAQRGRGPGHYENIAAVGAAVEPLVTRYKKAGVDYHGPWREQAMYGMGPRYWTLLGPLSGDEVPSPEAAAGFEPAPGQRGWSPVVWFGHDKIDLDRYYDDPANCSVFAFTYLHMAEPDSVRYWIGSDGGLQVWIDGESIYSFEGSRRHTLGMEQIPGYLEAGEHRLLVRADQKRGRFDFSFNVCEAIDDELYSGNRYPAVRYYLTEEGVPDVYGANRVRAEDSWDDWAEPYFAANLVGPDPMDLARTAPDSLGQPGPDSVAAGDLFGLAAAVAGLEDAHLDTTALACLSAMPFTLGYAGFHGWSPHYGPEVGRPMAWLGLNYDIRAGNGVREALKTAKGWLASGRTPLMAMGDDNWAVATGFRVVDDTMQVHLVGTDTLGWFARSRPRWARLVGGQWQQGPVAVVESAGPAIGAEALADSVAALALELGLMPWVYDDPESWGLPQYPAGLAAWDAWVAAWESAPFTAEWAQQKPLSWFFRELRQWSMPHLIDGRRRAGEYFSSAAARSSGARAELLTAAGQAYGETAGLLDSLLKVLPEQMGEAMEGEHRAQLDTLRQHRSLVRRARAAERRAVTALRDLTGGPELPPAAEDPLTRKGQGRHLSTWQADLSQGVYEIRLRGGQLEAEHLSGRETEGSSQEILAAVPAEPGWLVVAEAVRGVGWYTVVQQPAAENGWEAIVRVNDNWTDDTPIELVFWAVPDSP